MRRMRRGGKDKTGGEERVIEEKREERRGETKERAVRLL